MSRIIFWTHILCLYDGSVTRGYVPCLPGVPKSVSAYLESCHGHISCICMMAMPPVGHVPSLPGSPDNVGPCLEACLLGHMYYVCMMAQVRYVPCLLGGPDSIGAYLGSCLGHISCICM